MRIGHRAIESGGCGRRPWGPCQRRVRHSNLAEFAGLLTCLSGRRLRLVFRHCYLFQSVTRWYAYAECRCSGMPHATSPSRRAEQHLPHRRRTGTLPRRDARRTPLPPWRGTSAQSRRRESPASARHEAGHDLGRATAARPSSAPRRHRVDPVTGAPVRRLALVAPPSTWLTGTADDVAVLVSNRRSEPVIEAALAAGPLDLKDERRFRAQQRVIAPLGYARWDVGTQRPASLGETNFTALQSFFTVQQAVFSRSPRRPSRCPVTGRVVQLQRFCVWHLGALRRLSEWVTVEFPV